jgi:hypothetical protein
MRGELTRIYFEANPQTSTSQVVSASIQVRRGKWRAVFLSIEEGECAKEAARKEKLRLEHLEYMRSRGYDSQATSTPVHRSEQIGEFSQAARPTLPSLQTQTLGLSCDPDGEALTPALGVLAQDQAEASEPRTLVLAERKEGSLSIVVRGSP